MADSTSTAGPALPTPPRPLVDDIRSGNCIAIVGSGLSRAADGPSWGDLVSRIAGDARSSHPTSPIHTEIGTCLQREDFVTASDLLLRVLGDQLLADSVVHHVADPTLRPVVAHRYLRSLPFRSIITTNYDTLLERAAPAQGSFSVYWRQETEAHAAFQRGDRFLLKIHGDVNRRGQIVLARSQYQRLTTDAHLQQLLRTMFGSCRPVWVGYGHRDLTLDLVADFNEAFGAGNGYALVPYSHAAESRLSSAGITPCWLEHEQIAPFLGQIARALGVRVLFEVILAVDVKDVGEANKVGNALAGDLNHGSVSLFRADVGSVKLTLEASHDVLANLRSRIDAKDEKILGVLRRHKVAKFDGIELNPISVTDIPVSAGDRDSASARSAVVAKLESNIPATRSEGVAAIRKLVAEGRLSEVDDLLGRLRSYLLNPGETDLVRSEIVHLYRDAWGRGRQPKSLDRALLDIWLSAENMHGGPLSTAIRRFFLEVPQFRLHLLARLGGFRGALKTEQYAVLLAFLKELVDLRFDELDDPARETALIFALENSASNREAAEAISYRVRHRGLDDETYSRPT